MRPLRVHKAAKRATDSADTGPLIGFELKSYPPNNHGASLVRANRGDSHSGKSVFYWNSFRSISVAQGEHQ